MVNKQFREIEVFNDILQQLTTVQESEIESKEGLT